MGDSRRRKRIRGPGWETMTVLCRALNRYQRVARPAGSDELDRLITAAQDRSRARDQRAVEALRYIPPSGAPTDRAAKRAVEDHVCPGRRIVLIEGDRPLDLRDDQPNRADAKRQAVADLQWQTVQEETSKTSNCSTSQTSPRPNQGSPRLRGRTSRRHLAFASSGQVPSLSGCSGGVAASSTRNSRTPCTKPLQNATGRSWSGALIKLQSMADRVSSALRDWATRRSFARSSDARAAYSRPASSPLSKDLRSSFTKVF